MSRPTFNATSKDFYSYRPFHRKQIKAIEAWYQKIKQVSKDFTKNNLKFEDRFVMLNDMQNYMGNRIRVQIQQGVHA